MSAKRGEAWIHLGTLAQNGWYSEWVGVRTSEVTCFE